MQSMIIPSINDKHLHVMHLQDASSKLKAQKGAISNTLKFWDRVEHALGHSHVPGHVLHFHFWLLCTWPDTWACPKLCAHC